MISVERLSGTFSLSESSDKAEEALAPEPTAPRPQRRHRQPPLSAASFLLSADGTPTDGLLSMYCNINYSRDELHKFKFFDRQVYRDAKKEECKKELRAARAMLNMNDRKGQRRDGPQDDDLNLHERRQEVLRAGVTLKTKKRHLARLEVEERMELREDLNTLLSDIREGLVACYPYNEHLSRLSRRLDKISTHPELWAKYRPRLVHLHMNGFLRKWKDAGYPRDANKLLRKGQENEPPENEDRNPNAGECVVEEAFYPDEPTWEADRHSSGQRSRRTEPQEREAGDTKAATAAEGEPLIASGMSSVGSQEPPRWLTCSDLFLHHYSHYTQYACRYTPTFRRANS